MGMDFPKLICKETEKICLILLQLMFFDIKNHGFYSQMMCYWLRHIGSRTISSPKLGQMQTNFGENKHTTKKIKGEFHVFKATSSMSYIIVFCVSNQSGVAVPINGNHSDSILRRSEVPPFACLAAEAAASTQLNNHFFREKVSYHRSVHALT